MKTLKILGGIFGTIVLLGVIGYFAVLHPPAPEAVCDNVEKLSLAELKSQGIDAPDAMKAEMRKDCEKWASKRPEFGIGPWVKKLKCARDAESFSALEACGVKV